MYSVPSWMSGEGNPTARSLMRHSSPVDVMSPLPVASIATTRPIVPWSMFSSLCAT